MPKPKTVMCYICGREFSPHSISVHERQCAKRWEMTKQKEKDDTKQQQKRKSSHESRKRRVLPDLPTINKLQSLSLEDIRGSSKTSMSETRPSTVTIREQGQRLLKERSKSLATSTPLLRPETATLSGDMSDSSSEHNTLERLEIQSHSSTEHNTSDEEDIDKCSEATYTISKETRHQDNNTRPGRPILNGKSSHFQNREGSPESLSGSSDSQENAETGKERRLSDARFSSSSNPNLTVCYICGREYGSKSLTIHEPQCLKKWRLANPKRSRSPCGRKNGLSKARSVSSLTSHDAILHNPQKGTTLASSPVLKQSKPRSASCENLLDSSLTKRRPSRGSHQVSKMVLCYICGKQFTTHSLPIHEKQCLRKWEAQKKSEAAEKLQKVKQSKKRNSIHLPVTIKIDHAEENNNKEPVPRRSGSYGDLLTPELATSHNEDSSWADLPQEKESCTPSKPALVVCYLCGREYGSASISIHEKQCSKSWQTKEARKAKETLKSNKEKQMGSRQKPRSFVL